MPRHNRIFNALDSDNQDDNAGREINDWRPSNQWESWNSPSHHDLSFLRSLFEHISCGKDGGNNGGNTDPIVKVPTSEDPGTSVEEKGLPPHAAFLPAGSGESADNDQTNNDDTSELTAGQFVINASSGLQSVTIEGTEVTEAELLAATAAAPVDVAGQFGTLHITDYAPSTGVINYTYELTTNPLNSPAHPDSSSEKFTITVKDTGDQVSDSAILAISIADDAPIARPDTDSSADETTTAVGNVITGFDTNEGAPGTGTDSSGADGAAITQIDGAGATPTDNTADGLGEFQVTGAFGTLTINQIGTYTYTPNAGTAGQIDSFSYTLTDGDGDTSTATLAITIGEEAPTENALHIEKDADVTSVSNEGDVINYTMQVTNLAATPIAGVVVDDPSTDNEALVLQDGEAHNIGDLNDDDLLDSGETWQFTASHQVTAEEIAGGTDIVNVATVSGTDVASDDDDATVTIGEPNASPLHIEKDADVTSVSNEGDVISYTMQVTNLAATPIAGVVVDDPSTDNEAPVLQDGEAHNIGDLNDDDLLDSGETWQFTASHQVTAEEIAGGTDIVNVATVSGTDVASDDDDATVTIGNPAAQALLLVGSNMGDNSDSQDDLQHQHNIPNPAGPNFGVLLGAEGNDILIGDPGSDPGEEEQGIAVTTAAGNDAINGGAGNDVIFGDVPFTDTLRDSEGLDTTVLPNGSGVAVLATLEADTADAVNDPAGDGADWTGTDSIAYIQANLVEVSAEGGRTDGNDSLDGGEGDDAVFGQEGEDIIIGGAGTDTLSGGTGADHFRFNDPSDGTDNIIDLSGSGGDGDVIEISAAAFGGGLVAGGDASTGGLFGTSADATFGSGTERFHLDGSTNTLLYDADGSGAGSSAVALAVLENGAALDGADIKIVA